MKTGLAVLSALLFLGSGNVLAQERPAQPGAQPATERDDYRDADVAAADVRTGDVLTQRRAGQIRSDELVGSNVLDAAGENVATVNELLIDDDGTVAGLLVDVGGVLGLGASRVALAWDALEIRRVGEEGVFEDAWEVRTHMTRQELENAPEFADDDDGWF